MEEDGTGDGADVRQVGSARATEVVEGGGGASVAGEESEAGEEAPASALPPDAAVEGKRYRIAGVAFEFVTACGTSVFVKPWGVVRAVARGWLVGRSVVLTSACARRTVASRKPCAPGFRRC